MSDTDGDVATLTAAGANAVFARTNLVPFQVTMANVEKVDFQGQGGDNSFTIGDLTGTPITGILFSGGAGNDTLAGLANGVATAVPITASGGDGNDTLTGGTGADTLNGDAGNDTLEGHRGNDTLNGGDGDDLIIWRNGDGTDTVDGGAGTDTQQLIMSDAAGDVGTLTAAGANAVFARTNLVPFQVTMANVERVDFQGQGGDDTFTVGSLAGTTITAILFSGGDGNDTLDASAAAIGITASGGAGNDTLTGGTANDRLNGGPGADKLNGGGGVDSADYSTSPIGVTASLANPASNTGEALGDVYNSIEGLIGSPSDDLLIGDANDNTLVGGVGLDRLFGGGGNDTITDDTGASSEMNGEAGNDTIYGGPGNDYITGGDGDDVVVGGTDGQDSLFGGAGNDYIVAADANNDGVGSVLDGGAGANQLYALVGSGNDYAVGGEGTDIIATGAGSDYIFGNGGDDTIVAGTGTDYIYGGAGNDFIYTDDLDHQLAGFRLCQRAVRVRHRDRHGGRFHARPRRRRGGDRRHPGTDLVRPGAGRHDRCRRLHGHQPVGHRPAVPVQCRSRPAHRRQLPVPVGQLPQQRSRLPGSRGAGAFRIGRRDCSGRNTTPAEGSFRGRIPNICRGDLCLELVVDDRSPEGAECRPRSIGMH